MTGNYHLNNSYHTHPLEFEEVFLIQIGRLYCKENTVVDPHIHTDLFELSVITDGMGMISANSVPTPVKSGDIYLSMPGDIHKIESDAKKPLKYDFLALKIKDNPFKKELDAIAETYHDPTMRIIRDERIRQLTARAIAELTAPDLHTTELLNAIFRQILIYLIRDFQKFPHPKYPDNATGAEILCYKMMNYIDTHIYTLKNLSELCEATDYSYGYLSTVFRKTTSQTIHDYYNKRRAEASLLLLQENKLSATKIADTLGYSSLYAFSKAFKHQFGLSPKLYKKQLFGPIDHSAKEETPCTPPNS